MIWVQRLTQLVQKHLFVISLEIATAALAACLNMTKRLSPELTPFATTEMIKPIEDARIHPADRVLTNARIFLCPLASDNVPPPGTGKSPHNAKPQQTPSGPNTVSR